MKSPTAKARQRAISMSRKEKEESLLKKSDLNMSLKLIEFCICQYYLQLFSLSYPYILQSAYLDMDEDILLPVWTRSFIMDGKNSSYLTSSTMYL